jgi:hypothetical protein
LREQISFCWDDNDVSFVLDQLTEVELL